MSRIYYRGAKAAIVCFGMSVAIASSVHVLCMRCTCDCYLCADLTDSSSFDRAKFWVNELKQTEEVREIV